LYTMQHYSGLNLNDLPMKENVELSEDAYELLKNSVGEQKSYVKIEMVCATWLSLLNICNTNPNHTFSANKTEVESGFKRFLSDNVNDPVRNCMPRGLFSLLEKYLD
jgi:hypothetical protein